MSNTVLGLDLGSNSIGWALVDEAAGKLIGAGVRVFPEGVDRDQQGGEVSKNQARRSARAARRQTMRRRMRKKRVRDILVGAKLLPPDSQAQQGVFAEMDPYPLRRDALDRPLTPFEFGRLLYALNQRRGFLSNRKTDRQKKKETKGMLAEISELAADIQKAGHRTLGEHLASLQNDPTQRIRNRHTRRDMYEQEFHRIWESQKAYNCEVRHLLTDELKQLLFDPTGDDTWIHKGAIFSQRRMYWPISSVGRCDLERKERRCERADRLAQKFRLFQEVNNLRLIEAGVERSLTEPERTELIDYLMQSKERTFDEIRKRLKLPQTSRFNLESGDRIKLLGMPVDKEMAQKKIFGLNWYDKPDDERTAMVRFLLDHGDDEQTVRERARVHWGLDEAAVDRLLDVDLPGGHMSFSRLAICKLLPHLERGLPLMTSDGSENALHAAGYLRPDQRTLHQCDRLPVPPGLPNPIVRAALFEVRKLINAIIDEYGLPDAIHIEMAREVRGSAEQRARASKQMRERERERDAAADEIRNAGHKVTREAISRYLLWKEQDEICIYSGRPISFAQLFGGEIHLDHILPYSRSLDDSLANKVVSFRDSNATKGNQSPWEWLGGTELNHFEQVLLRAARLDYSKRRRFSQESVELEDFVQRQLRDTSYIATEVRQFIGRLGCDVIGTKGQLTAALRRFWGLDRILSELHGSPAWQEQSKLSPGEKDRSDHRHHVIDAIIIALTNRSRLHQLARQWQTRDLDQPWVGFRRDVQSTLDSMNVSHRVRRKVAGALHEETVYGLTKTDGEFVYRKPVEQLTVAMIADIRDEMVKGIILDRLAEFGIDSNGNQKIPAEVWKYPLLMTRKQGRHASNPSVIKKVRLIKRDKTVQPIRGGTAFVKPGSIHHLCIFEWEANGKTKRDAVFLTQLEAINRVKNKQPIIQRHPPVNHPTIPLNAKFKMSLSNGEMVLAELDGRSTLMVLQTSVQTEKKMRFGIHSDARKDNERRKVNMNINTIFSKYSAQKVTIDPLGRIRRAND